MAETLSRSGFTLAQLDRLIVLTAELGFWDDVQHWRAERAALVASAPIPESEGQR